MQQHRAAAPVADYFTAADTWHIKDAVDFNGDGHADILWQNDSGQAAVWLMNGTTPVSEANAGSNPGTDWHVIA